MKQFDVLCNVMCTSKLTSSLGATAHGMYQVFSGYGPVKFRVLQSKDKIRYVRHTYIIRVQRLANSYLKLTQYVQIKLSRISPSLHPALKDR